MQIVVDIAAQIVAHEKALLIICGLLAALFTLLFSFGYCCFRYRRRRHRRDARKQVAALPFDLEGGSPAAGAPLPPGILDACAKGDVFAIKAWIADEARAILTQFWRNSAQGSDGLPLTTTGTSSSPSAASARPPR